MLKAYGEQVRIRERGVSGWTAIDREMVDPIVTITTRRRGEYVPVTALSAKSRNTIVVGKQRWGGRFEAQGTNLDSAYTSSVPRFFIKQLI